MTDTNSWNVIIHSIDLITKNQAYLADFTTSSPYPYYMAMSSSLICTLTVTPLISSIL